MTADNPDVVLSDVIFHDFSNKVLGNTISNPSNAKYRVTTLATTKPSDFTVEATHDQYRRIKANDTLVWATSSTTSGIKAYHYYGFDIIGILTDHYGANLWQGATAIADKIAIAKKVITRLTVNWIGRGSSPSGNKALLQSWSVSLNKWDDANGASHTLSTDSSLSITCKSTYSTNTPANKIDTSGYFHALAFAEAANGTVASYVQTNYVSLEIETNIGHYDDDTVIRMNILEEISVLNESLPSNELELTLDNSSGDFDFINFQNMHKILASKPKLETELGLVLIDEPETKVVKSDLSGKIRYSNAENFNVYHYKYGTAMLTPTEFTAEPTQTHYDAVYTLDGSTSYLNAGVTSGNFAQGMFSFDVIAILTKAYGEGVWRGKTALSDKIAIAESLITDFTVNWHGYASTLTGYNATIELWDKSTNAWDTANKATHTNSTVTKLSLTVSRGYSSNIPRNKIDASGFIRFHTFSDPADGTTATFVRTDYVDIELTVSPVVQVEWIPTGTFFITEWKNDITNKIISLIANDYFALLSDISYEPTTITNLKSLAADVLTKGGIPTNKQILDTSLDAITVNAVSERIDMRTLLQYIGIVGVSCVGQDRYGNVFIKPFLTIDQVSNYITYPTTQNTLYGYPSPNTYPINNTTGGMRYLDYDQMYEAPDVSIEKSIYQLVIKYYPNGAANDPVELVYINTSIGGTNGLSFTIDNPLIKTTDQTNKISTWYIKEGNNNAFYTAKWRQNPALEPTDIILVEDAFEAEKQTRIVRNELNYEGYLEGITESRGGV